VEQYRKCLNHQTSLKWRIEISGVAQRKRFSTCWVRNPLFDRAIASLYFERIKLGPLKVKKIVIEEIIRRRPIPLRTVELQKFLTKFLKLSSSKLMEITESLYMKGFISYPRTETDIFKDDFPFVEIFHSLESDLKLGPFCETLKNVFQKPRNGKNDDMSHPPIHPLKSGNDLSGIERQVFEFISRRFLASCMYDAKGQERLIYLMCNNEIFFCRSLKITEKNYLEVYIYDHWTDKILPEFNESMILNNWEVKLREDSISPPRLLDESSLISCMDRNQIGTDATIHDHIKKIFDRKYIVESKSRELLPTNMGLIISNYYDSFDQNYSLTKPALRSKLETKVLDIIQGSCNKESVIKFFIEEYKKIFFSITANFDGFLSMINQFSDPIAAIDDKVGEIRCNCGLIAKKCVSRKSTSSGKSFYCCIKIAHKCKFFQWL
jgi:DNA topoisomerase III